ncbi:hypothetical protein D1872_228720 [compost metagenome]
MSYPKSGNVIQSRRNSFWPLGSALCQPKVFTRVLGTAISMNRQVPYMKLIDNRIKMFNKRRFIIRPTLGIRTAQIQNGCLISVDCYRFSIRISRLVPHLANLDPIHVQHILAVLSYSQYPCSLHITVHRNFTNRLSVPGLVEHDQSFRSGWCPQSELGSLW